MERKREQLIIPLRRRQMQWEQSALGRDPQLASSILVGNEDREGAAARGTTIAFIVLHAHINSGAS